MCSGCTWESGAFDEGRWGVGAVEARQRQRQSRFVSLSAWLCEAFCLFPHYRLPTRTSHRPPLPGACRRYLENDGEETGRRLLVRYSHVPSPIPLHIAPLTLTQTPTPTPHSTPKPSRPSPQTGTPSPNSPQTQHPRPTTRRTPHPPRRQQSRSHMASLSLIQI